MFLGAYELFNDKSKNFFFGGGQPPTLFFQTATPHLRYLSRDSIEKETFSRKPRANISIFPTLILF